MGGQCRGCTDIPLDAEYGPAKPGETFRIYLDAQKALNELEWQPEVLLIKGLADTVDYFKQAEIQPHTKS